MLELRPGRIGVVGAARRMRSLLTADRERRTAALGRPPTRWTDAQAALFASPHRLTVWWGANGIGKSMALAELARRAIAGNLPWQAKRPQCVIVAGNTWTQIGVVMDYFWQGVDKAWFKEGIRFEAGGMKGQRLHVYDIVGGPGKGGQLRLGTFDAENLAGPRADCVITDEPLPERVHNELWPRLLGRNGRMYEGFTPTLGTSTKVEYLWEIVDTKEWAGAIQTVLCLDAVTPRGGIVEVPWISQAEIDAFVEGVSASEVEMRMGRSRTPRAGQAYFSAWGPHLVRDEPPPPGSQVGVGIDHGSRPGAQRAALVACGGKGIGSRIWVMDEYKGDGRTESEQDARGILDMLSRNGLRLEDVDLWVGDRGHRGDHKGGVKSNTRLLEAIARELGMDAGRRGWGAKLPEALRRISVPRKYDRSVWEGCEIMHRLMVGREPRISVHPRCVHLIEDFQTWQGSSTDPAKDGIDALRYSCVPMVEGERR